MANQIPHSPRGWSHHATDVPRVALREVWATARAAVSPISRLRPLPPRIPAGRPPALLVHGYMGHPDMLRALERALIHAGWHRVVRLGYPSHRLTLEQIAQRIDAAAIPLAAGEPIHLVGHSLGAVACRAWLKAFGGHQFVRHFVSLGGPHAGTKLYRFTPPALWPVLNPEGPWVQRLNRDPEPVPTTVVRARYDHQVLPARRIHIDAPEVVLDRVGHNGLLWSRKAHTAVVDALRD